MAFEAIKRKPTLMVPIIFGFFVVYAILSFFFSDSLGNYIMNAPFLIQLILFFVLNPYAVLIALSMYSVYSWRGLISSLFLVSAIEIMWVPHGIMLDGLVPTSPSFFPLLDVIVYKNFYPLLSNWILYIPLVIGLVAVSLLLVEGRTFVSIFKRVV